MSLIRSGHGSKRGLHRNRGAYSAEPHRHDFTDFLAYKPPAVPMKPREYRERPKPPLKPHLIAVLELLTDKPQKTHQIHADCNVSSALWTLQARGLARRLNDGSGWVKA